MSHKGGRAPKVFQPFLQQKAELEANERYELEAEEKSDELEARNGKYGIGGDGERHELPAKAHTSGSFVATCELGTKSNERDVLNKCMSQ